MTGWVRINADYFTHPKILRAGRDGRDLHLASICYFGMHPTDTGEIPADVVPQLKAWAKVRGTAPVDALVAAGLWIPDGAGSYYLHDYDMNPTRTQREDARKRNAFNQRAHRARRGDGWE